MNRWPELETELDRWQLAGRTAAFWWRDDDAVDDTPQLTSLLAAAAGIPVAIAVIPAYATPALARRLAAYPWITVIQHGWRHDNHSPDGSSEYPPGRDPAVVAREFAEGVRILRGLFSTRYRPVFAPPWHGFDDAYLPLLPPSGLAAISRKGARASPRAAGIPQSNIHAVPIVWSQPPGFGDEAAHLGALIDHLAARRARTSDAAEPTGILTHHLVQDEASWEFMRRLGALVARHPASRWCDIETIFFPQA
jgi:hypothetical protein